MALGVLLACMHGCICQLGDNSDDGMLLVLDHVCVLLMLFAGQASSLSSQACWSFWVTPTQLPLL